MNLKDWSGLYNDLLTKDLSMLDDKGATESKFQELLKCT